MRKFHTQFGPGDLVRDKKTSEDYMKNYHHQEAERIQKELNNLSSTFAEDGIVRTILRQRIEDEKEKSSILTKEIL